MRPRGLPSPVVVASVVFLACLSLARGARAQVNTENLRKRVHNVGYTLLVEGTLTGDTGNTTGITAGGGVGGGLAKDPHLAFAYGRVDYARYNGVTSVAKAFAHVRYNYAFDSWIWGEVFAQAQTDEFQRMKLRNLVGVGPRFLLAHVPPVDGENEIGLFYGTAYMIERDVIEVLPGAPDQETQFWSRWSNYVTAQWQMDERAIFATTLYAQPAFVDFTNIRVLDETLFTFKVTKLLTASLAFTIHYDSDPPTGVRPTDAEVKNVLGFTY